MNTFHLPPIFVSHGAPLIALQPGAAGAFMARLGPVIDATFGRPKAILAISAHTAARAPVLLAAARHEAVHDFGNFDPRLFTLRYDAPGAPALAAQVAQQLAHAQRPVHTLDQGGLDHGIWTVLRYLYPGADVPVLPLAFVPGDSPAEQFALGATLASWSAAGVLVLATGSITHNLRRALAAGLNASPDQPEVPESTLFRDWFAARSGALDWDALLDYRGRAPHAADMHPSDEHLLPWFVAAGAGGRQHAPQRLHASVTFGCIGMDAYAFGAQAGALADALAPALAPALK